MPYKHKEDMATYMRQYRQLQKIKTAYDQAELTTLKKAVKEIINANQ